MICLVTLELSPSQIGPADHQDVAVEDPGVDLGPGVGLPPVLAHVRVDTGGDVVVDGADHLDRDAVLAHDRRARIDQALRVAGLRAALQSAVDERCPQAGEVQVDSHARTVHPATTGDNHRQVTDCLQDRCLLGPGTGVPGVDLAEVALAEAAVDRVVALDAVRRPEVTLPASPARVSAPGPPTRRLAPLLPAMTSSPTPSCAFSKPFNTSTSPAAPVTPEALAS